MNHVNKGKVAHFKVREWFKPFFVSKPLLDLTTLITLTAITSILFPDCDIEKGVSVVVQDLTSLLLKS